MAKVSTSTVAWIFFALFVFLGGVYVGTRAGEFIFGLLRLLR